MLYEPFGCFIYRVPRFSYENLEKNISDISKLKTLMMDMNIRNCINSASPLLIEEIDKYLSGHITKEKERKRVILSFVKYYKRMCTRCTPFGMLATYGTGMLSDHNQMEISSQTKQYTSFDMFFLSTISQLLQTIPEIIESTKYKPNTTLYKVGERYRYIEYEYFNDNRKHVLSSVKRNSILDRLLDKFKKGAFLSEIREYLVSYGYDKNDVSNYIEELIHEHILVNTLENCFMGDDFGEKIIGVLSNEKYKDPQIIKIRDVLTIIKDRFQIIDSNSNIDQNREFIYICKIAEKIIPNITPKLLKQIDLSRFESNICLNKDIIEKIDELLCFLQTINYGYFSALDDFKNAFRSRYEEEEIPLLEALDPDIGVGFPVSNGVSTDTPLLNMIHFPVKTPEKKIIMPDFLIKKYLEAVKKGNKTIVFTKNDYLNKSQMYNKLPFTACSYLNLITVDGKLSLIFKALIPNAGNLLSRFAYSDNKIKDVLLQITHKEQELQREGLYAEIVHVPNERVSNLVQRPHIRDYEINILSNSDLLDDSCIPVSDITMSIRNNEIVLKSKKLKKRIFPRLTNAHNFSNSTQPIYKFLCLLQSQENSGLYFDISYFIDQIPYFPRVLYNDIILSPAQWIIGWDEVKNCFRGDEINYHNEIRKWRHLRGIPQKVYVYEGGNELYLDFENKLSIDVFVKLWRNGKVNSVKMVEFLTCSSGNLFKGYDGYYTNEILVPMYLKQE